MGSILDISCSECRYNNEYFLGIGEFFSERNQKSISLVNKIAGIDKQRIIIADSFVQVFRCFGCNGLFNKMHIRYRVKDSVQFNYNLLYECIKCKEPIYPLFSEEVQCSHHLNHVKSAVEVDTKNDYELYYYEKVLKDIPCYKCGNRKLYLSAWGVFD
ncbi:MAG: hypothetical protein ABI528_06650 [bacterium]